MGFHYSQDISLAAFNHKYLTYLFPFTLFNAFCSFCPLLARSTINSAVACCRPMSSSAAVCVGLGLSLFCGP